ncbi:sortase [Leifsonia shinshuensis]|uniref:sortase n=1 Tax=Leifsonia shinshuensis TaxID=150026 RepID=UPI001F511CA8|nr:sortase [Leifsonia shinshuensis]MCI0157016.1 sortase [Leifsonia shinshuensis]
MSEDVQTRPPGQPKPPRPPKPPRRPPAPPREPILLSPAQKTARAIALLAAIVLIGFAANILLLSHVHHLVGQQVAGNTFREELAAATAPVSEGDVDGVLLPDGVPVAVIAIPSIGLNEVVLEGSSSGVTANGPGHRRDTVLPGQAGTSVVLGRAAAYGGPFSGIQGLAPGARIVAITGQGKSVYRVIGVRYAGDPDLPALRSSEGRLTLETARGLPYVPSGVVRVDAELISKAKDPGVRQTTAKTLPLADRELASDPSTAWLLVFALQALVAALLLGTRALHRFGAQRTWIVFAPILLAAGIIAADQVSRLLPNLL